MSRGSAGDKGSGAAENQRRLALTLVLVVIYMVAEIVGGLLTNSLALLADAGHMLSDAAALGLAPFAIWFARRPPTPQHTYGYYRAEIRSEEHTSELQSRGHLVCRLLLEKKKKEKEKKKQF